MGKSDINVNRGTLDIFQSYPLNKRRTMGIYKNANATTISTYGLAAAPTSTATVSSNDSGTGWTSLVLRHTTSAVLGNASGIISGAFDIVAGSWNCEFSTNILLQNTSGYRCAVGFFEASPDALDWLNTSPATRFMGFCYENPTAGPSSLSNNWVCVAAQGGTVTRTATGIVGDTNSVSLRAIRGQFLNNGVSTNGIQYYINGKLVATHFVSVASTMGYGIRITNTSAATHYVEWNHFLISHD